MDIVNLQTKLSVAADSLAKGPGRIKERLHDAAITLTSFGSEEHFPIGEFRNDFEVICSALCAATECTEGEGLIQATLNQMSAEQAMEIAGKILKLQGRVDRKVQQQQIASLMEKAMSRVDEFRFDLSGLIEAVM